MGFDVFGKEPVNETGTYFRNNIWCWRPLWNYVFANLKAISEEDYFKGSHNDGHEINKEKAQRIAASLKQKIESGELEEYIEAYTKYLDELPEEPCDYCDSLGLRELPDSNDLVQCNGCGGSGKVKSFETYYPMYVENMKNFADFCQDSGGFKIY